MAAIFSLAKKHQLSVRLIWNSLGTKSGICDHWSLTSSIFCGKNCCSETFSHFFMITNDQKCIDAKYIDAKCNEIVKQYTLFLCAWRILTPAKVAFGPTWFGNFPTILYENWCKLFHFSLGGHPATWCINWETVCYHGSICALLLKNCFLCISFH